MPETAPLLARYPRLVDETLDFPGFPGLPEVPVDPGRIAAFFLEQQSWRYDLALQLHGSGACTNQFAVLLGAAHTAGFYLPAQFCPEPGLFVRYSAERHEIHRLLEVVAHIGAPLLGDHLEFPVTISDRRRLHEVTGSRLRRFEFAVMHAGAKDPRRCWPLERFAAVASDLTARGIPVVLTGTAGERPMNARIAGAAGEMVTDLTGETDLGSLAALVADARLVVCNDTGIAHLAAALRTPSVVVFSASDPLRWGALDTALHRAVAPARDPFDSGDHCLRDACVKAPWNRPSCIPPVPVRDVLREIEGILRLWPRTCALIPRNPPLA